MMLKGSVKHPAVQSPKNAHLYQKLLANLRIYGILLGVFSFYHKNDKKQEQEENVCIH